MHFPSALLAILACSEAGLAFTVRSIHPRRPGFPTPRSIVYIRPDLSSPGWLFRSSCQPCQMAWRRARGARNTRHRRPDARRRKQQRPGRRRRRRGTPGRRRRPARRGRSSRSSRSTRRWPRRPQQHRRRIYSDAAQRADARRRGRQRQRRGRPVVLPLELPQLGHGSGEKRDREGWPEGRPGASWHRGHGDRCGSACRRRGGGQGGRWDSCDWRRGGQGRRWHSRGRRGSGQSWRWHSCCG